MSDTPRTDAVISYGPHGYDALDGGWVRADFARQLERQRNALDAALRERDKRMSSERTNLLDRLAADGGRYVLTIALLHEEPRFGHVRDVLEPPHRRCLRVAEAYLHAFPQDEAIRVETQASRREVIV